MRRSRGALAALALLLAATVTAGCDTAQQVAAGPSRGIGPPATEPASSPPPHDGRAAGFSAGPPGTGLARFYAQHVAWAACGFGLRCADVQVPLNYARPDGTAISIAAEMRPAADPSRKVGTLFLNPGGPGGSGVAFLSQFQLDSSVSDVFDVVGFDPRGVGRSTAVRCVSDSVLDRMNALNPAPDTPSEVRAVERLTREFAAACLRNSGPLLAHVSTIEAARDLDILRAVVHDPKLNFYGASYGTYLGATYAALFPGKVGRLVLDGAVDPEQTPRQSALAQAGGVQTAFTAYLRDCVASGRCPMGSSVATAEGQVEALMRRIEAHPLPTLSGRPLTEGLALLGIVAPLYDRATWPYETAGLDEALRGNGDNLMYLADQYSGRTPGGHYRGNSAAAQAAIGCLDDPDHETVAQIRSSLPAFTRVSPIFGPPEAWSEYMCAHWPVRSTLPKPDYAAPGAPPIVVVGTTRDPATPYRQAVSLAHELDSGVLLSRDGDGHTAYDSGNECIRSAVDRFLVHGTPPAAGTMC